VYYLVLKALDKYPSAAELAVQAEERIIEGAEKAGGVLREGYGNITVAKV